VSSTTKSLFGCVKKPHAYNFKIKKFLEQKF
jgi:hypothetical protein